MFRLVYSVTEFERNISNFFEIKIIQKYVGKSLFPFKIPDILVVFDLTLLGQNVRNQMVD